MGIMILQLQALSSYMPFSLNITILASRPQSYPFLKSILKYYILHPVNWMLNTSPLKYFTQPCCANLNHPFIQELFKKTLTPDKNKADRRMKKKQTQTQVRLPWNLQTKKKTYYSPYLKCHF